MSEALSEVEAARLLLEAARYLGETLDPARVYVRFREIVADAIPHDGVVVSSFDPAESLISCDYAWADGETLDVSAFPPLRPSAGAGMQSEVIRTGEPLLVRDVSARVRDAGTYYDVDREGRMRKVPDEGPPKARSALMLPVKQESAVVGVVQLWSDRLVYDRGQLELAEGIVAQMAAAVRNARLHEERLQLEAAAAAARAAAAERERAAHILDAVGDGIFSVGGDGAVTFWNRAAARITGLAAESARAHAFAGLAPGWDGIERSVPVAQRDELPRPVTLPLETPDGRELWLSFVAVRSGDEVVYAFRDVTRERRLEEAKNDLIATVSHELRTPMTAVLGAARTLLHVDLEASPESQRRLLEMIESQAERLSKVTENVLLAGQIDRDAIEPDTGRVDVEQVLAETIEALAPSLPATLTVVQRFEGVGGAVADPQLLQQVVINLLDNAVKHSPEDGVVVVATRRSGAWVEIDVADRGEGLPPAEQPRIFEKFYRSGASRQRIAGGTGLGLYICRELSERMGGRISVDSAPGRGATFTVALAAAGA